MAFEFGAQVFRALRRDLLHGHALVGEGREVAIEFQRVHDDDFFNLCLGKNRQNLVKLVVRG